MHAADTETNKNIQQDDHMIAIDQKIDTILSDRKDIRKQRDAEVESLRVENTDLQSRISRDEGLAAGAAGIVGILSTLGLLKKKSGSAE